MTGKELYQIFLGMKLHFTSDSYDYLKYGPKKVDESSMGKHFVLSSALGRKFKTKEELETRLISIFKTKPVWLNEICTPEAEKLESEHNAALSGFSYNLEQHLGLMQQKFPANMMMCFKTRDSFQVPEISRMLLNKEINLESYIALDSLLGFSKDISDLIWKQEKLKAKKYSSFFTPDVRKVAKVAKKFFVRG
jgi:hypothetical protein